jgi:hypothetical protein
MPSEVVALIAQLPNLAGLLIAIIVLKDELTKLRTDVSTKIDKALEILQSSKG